MRHLIAILVAALLAGGCSRGDRVTASEDDGPITWVRNSDFTGPRMEVVIELEDGRRATVNSLDDAVDTRPAATPMPGHQARDWTFLRETEHGTSIVFAVTSWDPANPADYIMAGWWAEFPGQHPPHLDVNQAARYGIVDGPEIDTRYPPDLPVDGQATYVGQTGGLYRYLPPGGGAEDILTEEYQGTVTLSADFAGGTLHGCIGCVGDLVSRREHFNYFLGDERRFDAGPFIADFEIHLGAAPLKQNGTFGSYDVTVTHPGMRGNGESAGFWGGSMSGTADADGNPRLAAGFTIGRYEDDGGRRGSFVGSFLALSERFRAGD